MAEQPPRQHARDRSGCRRCGPGCVRPRAGRGLGRSHDHHGQPRHKAANWVGPGRTPKSTRPGANVVVGLTPFEFLDRLADLVPPPRKHRHRYHGVFTPNHKLLPAVTTLAIGNVGKRRDAATDGHAVGGHAVGGHAARGDATGDCCDSRDQPRSHDTSRIARAKLMARVGEEFPFACAWVRRRHPAHRIHHRTGADPDDSDTPRRTARTASAFTCPWPAYGLGRARANARRRRRPSGVTRRIQRKPVAEVSLTGLSFGSLNTAGAVIWSGYANIWATRPVRTRRPSGSTYGWMNSGIAMRWGCGWGRRGGRLQPLTQVLGCDPIICPRQSPIAW